MLLNETNNSNYDICLLIGIYNIKTKHRKPVSNMCERSFISIFYAALNNIWAISHTSNN